MLQLTQILQIGLYTWKVITASLCLSSIYKSYICWPDVAAAAAAAACFLVVWDLSCLVITPLLLLLDCVVVVLLLVVLLTVELAEVLPECDAVEGVGVIDLSLRSFELPAADPPLPESWESGDLSSPSCSEYTEL